MTYRAVLLYYWILRLFLIPYHYKYPFHLRCPLGNIKIQHLCNSAHFGGRSCATVVYPPPAPSPPHTKAKVKCLLKSKCSVTVW